MKLRLFLVPAVCLGLLVFSAVSARSQTLVTFDDLSPLLAGTLIPNGYQGLSWSNFGVANSILLSNFYGYANGYNYGMVSASNVAFNWLGNPAEIDSATNFNFLSAYLTGAWNSNLNIEVQGFSGTNLVYDETKVVSVTNATLFTFNFLDIDRLYFDSYGGEPAFGGSSRFNFVMDNFEFEFIPEPSTFLLAALGGLSLIAFLRRKRG
ncbi:MAG: PEP-CTERM sorting domain-containing protein [Verrucomicrobiia bacterium]